VIHVNSRLDTPPLLCTDPFMPIKKNLLINILYLCQNKRQRVFASMYIVFCTTIITAIEIWARLVFVCSPSRFLNPASGFEIRWQLHFILCFTVHPSTHTAHNQKFADSQSYVSTRQNRVVIWVFIIQVKKNKTTGYM
jgi:hypothetical protein